MPEQRMPKKLELNRYMKTTRPYCPNIKKKKKKTFFSSLGIGMKKVRSQEIPGVTGKFGLGVQNEAG